MGHGRPVWGSKRGRRGANRGNPAILPWSTDGTQKKRHQSNHTTTKKEKPGLGLALPSPVRPSPGVPSLSRAAGHRVTLTLHDLQNGDCRAQPFGPVHHLSHGDQPVQLHNPRTGPPSRRSQYGSRRAERVEILTRRDWCPASSTSSWTDHADNRHIPHDLPRRPRLPRVMHMVSSCLLLHRLCAAEH